MDMWGSMARAGRPGRAQSGHDQTELYQVRGWGRKRGDERREEAQVQQPGSRNVQRKQVNKIAGWIIREEQSSSLGWKVQGRGWGIPAYPVTGRD